MIIADTSGLFAYYNAGDVSHDAVKPAVDGTTDRFVVSPFVIGELDYLLGDRVGVEAELAALGQFAAGAYDVAPFDAEDIGRAAEVIDKYRDQNIGLTDASMVVLADRYKTKQILTLDHRHFDVLRPLSGGRFKLLP